MIPNTVARQRGWRSQAALVLALVLSFGLVGASLAPPDRHGAQVAGWLPPRLHPVVSPK